MRKKNRKKYCQNIYVRPVIDYNVFAKKIVQAQVQANKELANKELKLKEDEKNEWRNRIGFIDYSNKDVKFKRIREDLNACKCFFRMLSGKKEYRRPGVLEAFCVRYLNVLFYWILSSSFLAASLMVASIPIASIAKNIFSILKWPCKIILMSFGVPIDINQLFDALVYVSFDLNFANVVLLLIISGICTIISFLFRAIMLDIESRPYDNKEEVSKLLNFLLGK